jgi:hypothetical protein
MAEVIATAEAPPASPAYSPGFRSGSMLLLTRVDAFAEFIAAYERVMGDHQPPRSTVGVELAGGYLVEIEGLGVIE